MISYKVEFEKLPWETPMKGNRFKVFRNNHKQIRLVEYSRNMEQHWCEKNHFGYVLEGKFEIEFQNQAVVFEPGDGIFIPGGPGNRHRGKSLTEKVRVVFVEDV